MDATFFECQPFHTRLSSGEVGEIEDKLSEIFPRNGENARGVLQPVNVPNVSTSDTQFPLLSKMFQPQNSRFCTNTPYYFKCSNLGVL
ncbi:hypothetical protein CK203_015753 [Vitis vinifera]|uniref:Uncharacterized protein n=1 Tax=Vitis vinifera TaxID=29760 RepID=A0A438JRF0_VITVI|nr:hypothetical protein CK203_015753 [Vitis vinifera]